MCSTCAGAFRFDADEHDDMPDTHDEAGESCPVMYR